MIQQALHLLGRPHVAHVELYHRRSRTVRVTLGDDDDLQERSGCDEGTALRLWLAGEQGARFTALSGSAPESIARAADQALTRSAPLSDSPPERCSVARVLVDHDDVPLPDEATLGTWLVAAREQVAAHPGQGSAIARAWIEAASTHETWVVDGEAIASRLRTRGWAGIEEGLRAGGEGRPLILASRYWNCLDPAEWVRMLDWRRGLDRAPDVAGARPMPLLLSPEAAASVVLALVRTLPSLGKVRGVGAGFRIADLPGEPAALFGGAFDDVGCETTPCVLSDGTAILGRLQGPGHFRRPSFRDVPLEMPSNLVATPPISLEPPDRWVAHRVSVHAVSLERWVLDLDATLWRQGEPVGTARGAHVGTSPQELLAACSAGIGPPAVSHRGVRTPALLFEGLSVRP